MDEHLFMADRRVRGRQSADTQVVEGSVFEYYGRLQAICKWTNTALRQVGLRIDFCWNSAPQHADSFELQLRRGCLAVSVVGFVTGKLGRLSGYERKWIRDVVDAACGNHDRGFSSLKQGGDFDE
jgi:hypothetical protein